MAGMTEEQKKKLMEIELAEKEAVAQGAPKMSAGQKAAVLMYGTIPIEVEKPEPPKSDTSTSLVPKDVKVVAQPRQGPTIED